MEVSVLIPTHNPATGRLRRTLDSLRSQTLPTTQWETILIDNASAPPLDDAALAPQAPPNFRLVRESQLGLTAARRCAFREARAPLCVLVDDDNVLAPDYLAQVVHLFATHPAVAACGGRSAPEFEREPEPWQHEFFPLLALRDLGPAPLIARGLRAPNGGQNQYPHCAPIGAGMAIRREPALAWAAEKAGALVSDRRGGELTSGGDNDIVLWLLRADWAVAYFPALSLTHLIPDSRLHLRYLARLNRGIQNSWMRVLAKYDANPWPPLASWTVPLRQLKAWFTHRAWNGPAAYVRWQGACGHFEGRARRGE